MSISVVGQFVAIVLIQGSVSWALKDPPSLVMNLPACITSDGGKSSVQEVLLYVGQEEIQKTIIAFSLLKNLTWNCQDNMTYATVNPGFLGDPHCPRVIFTKFNNVGFNSGMNLTDKQNATATVWYNSNEFCGRISTAGKQQFEVGICKASAPQELTVRKCCAPGYWYSQVSMRHMICQEDTSNLTWVPTLYDPSSFGNQRCVTRTQKQANYRVVTHHGVFDKNVADLRRDPSYDPDNDIETPRVSWRLLSDGSLAVKGKASRFAQYPFWAIFGSAGTMFCVDRLINFNPKSYYNNKFTEVASIAMSSDSQEEFEDEMAERSIFVKTRIYLSICFMAAILMGLLIVAVVCNPTKGHDHRTIIILIHFISTFIENVFAGTAAAMTIGLPSGESRSWPCYIVAVCKHYFSLVSITSVLMVTWDVWRTLRTLAPLPNAAYSTIRYFIYTLLIFGVPGVIVAITLTLDHFYGDFGRYDSDCDYILPRYGMEWCSLSIRGESFYLILPNGTLIVVNAFLFIGAIVSHCKSTHSANISVLSGERRRQRREETIQTFLKLAALTGVNLTLDHLVWGWEWSMSSPFEISYGSLIMSVCNIFLRPALLFWIYGCKRLGYNICSEWCLRHFRLRPVESVAATNPELVAEEPELTNSRRDPRKFSVKVGLHSRKSKKMTTELQLVSATIEPEFSTSESREPSPETMLAGSQEPNKQVAEKSEQLTLQDANQEFV